MQSKLTADGCPVCKGAGDFVFSQRDLFLGIDPAKFHSVFYCAACDFFYLNAMGDEEISKYYPAAYYQRPTTILHQLRTNLRARSIVKGLTPGTFVDVGCGRGEVLQALKRRGWSVFGTDWNESNAERVSRSLNIPVYGGQKAWEQFEAGSIDVVSLLHVLEHDSAPVSLLGKVHRILKPDGRLVVGVPNSRSLPRKLFGRHWMGYDIPRHRCVFSPKSLQNCLETSGFQIDRVSGRFSDEILDITGSCRLLWNDRRPYTSAKLLATALPRVVFGSLLVPGPGSVLYAYAHKR